MITDKFIIRRADNILHQNEIAKFYPMYFYPDDNISAISIENTKVGILSEDRYKLLCYASKKICSQIEKIKIMVCLYGQPDTKIIKYKGGWGILKSQLVDVNKIESKKEIIFERNAKVDFILEGVINIKDGSIIKKILDITNAVYFSIGEKQGLEPKIKNHDDWINYMLDVGGNVLFFLGLGLEASCELVIMRKSKDILELFK